jgi:histidine triad (HIT) family protein
MTNCVFCGILDESVPASIVYRDDQCTALLDIQPVNPGHVLIIPNQHAAYLADIDAETAGHLFQVAQRIAAALRRCGVWCEGINMFLADGEAAMQEVFHVHLHVFPRYQGDGFGLTFGPSYYTKPPLSTLDTIAAQIRAVL